jgi:hypothetical protein
MKLEFSRQTFKKSSNIKFHENPSSGSRVVPANLQTDMMKLTVAFRNFANAPNTLHHSNIVHLKVHPLLPLTWQNVVNKNWTYIKINYSCQFSGQLTSWEMYTQQNNSHTFSIFCVITSKTMRLAQRKLLCMCVLFLSRTSVPNIFPSNKYVASYPQNVRSHAYRSSCKVLLLLKKLQKT